MSLATLASSNTLAAARLHKLRLCDGQELSCIRSLMSHSLVFVGTPKIKWGLDLQYAGQCRFNSPVDGFMEKCQSIQPSIR